MDWANELEEMKKMSDDEYKMYYGIRFCVDNQIISVVLSCISFGGLYYVIKGLSSHI